MAQKLWEKSVQVNQEIERFTVGRDREMDLYLAKYDVLGSMAHITMLQSIGLLTQEELDVLLTELRHIYADADQGNFIIEPSRNASNISDPMLELIYSEKVNDSLTQRSSGIGSPVSDPFQHASTWYGGTYTCNDYQNKWEDYIECTLISSYSGYAEHCVPTAITNMLIMYGNRYNKSTITSKTSNQIFSTVATIGTSNSYYTNSSTGGTTNSTANAYIRDSFNNYSVTSTVNGQYNMNYTNIEISLRNNRLAYLMTTNHSYYLNHHIVCYAYKRLVNNSGTYATYIKVIDGWASSPRYIDISSLSSNKYWEVQF